MQTLDELAKWHEAKADGFSGTRGVSFETHTTAAATIRAAMEEIERFNREVDRAWTERNVAYAKVKAWEAVVYVEGLPLRAVAVNEWGPGEGGQTTVPEITPRKLTALLDEIATLRAALKKGPAHD